MEQLFEIQKIIIEEFLKEPFFDRHVFKEITLDNKITGIVGSKGIGKTTILLHRAIQAGAQNNRVLYTSADQFYFLEHRLIDLVDQLYKETDVRLLCIDEIHKYANWEQELKNISDIYRSFRILFSGSSMIDIIRSKYDLSRRATIIPLHGLSFREYLEFYLGLKLPTISVDELIKHHFQFAQSLHIPQILKHFKDYLKMGYYPFFKEFKNEREKYQAIENTTQKTIYEDIATLHSLKTPTLLLIEKLYKYVLNSLPGELSVNKLANTLGKDFDSISEYFKLLEQAGLVRFLYPNKSGKAFLRNPIKMYPENTNLIYASYLPQTQDSSIGKIRETFVINHFNNANIPLYYSEVGDFATDDIIFEVGGKNKTMKQLKNHKNGFLLCDSILLGDKHTIPLYLIGFLY